MLDRLRELNPWWFAAEAIQQDRHLRALAASPFQRPIPLLHELRLDAPIVYTLRGPRQVGKTTTAKLLVRQLLERGVDPRHIIYYALDLERDPNQIVELIRQARLMGTRAAPSPQAPERYILLDEISSVPEWQHAIKYLRDHTAAANDFFLLTGSVASDVRRGAERLPGRRGPEAALDRVLLPLSFPEFAAATDPSLPSPPCQVAPPDFLTLADDLSAVLLQNQLFIPALDRLLERYVQVGGFPPAVRDALATPTGEVSEVTMRILWDMIAGDVVRMGRDPFLALRHLERLKLDLGNALSWTSLAQAVGVASYATAEDYIRILAEAFQVLTLSFWDLAHASVAPRRGHKLYPFDPLLLRFPALLTGVDRPPDLGKCIEAIVAAALFRAVERDLLEAFNVPRGVFYWRSARGNEVDFLVGIGPKKVPIEVKYQQQIHLADGQTMRQAFGEGILLSRTRLDLRESVRIIPASLFLWLLAS